jgi:hypothetical protein
MNWANMNSGLGGALSNIGGIDVPGTINNFNNKNYNVALAKPKKEGFGGSVGFFEVILLILFAFIIYQICCNHHNSYKVY